MFYKLTESVAKILATYKVKRLMTIYRHEQAVALSCFVPRKNSTTASIKQIQFHLFNAFVDALYSTNNTASLQWLKPETFDGIVKFVCCMLKGAGIEKEKVLDCMVKLDRIVASMVNPVPVARDRPHRDKVTMYFRISSSFIRSTAYLEELMTHEEDDWQDIAKQISCQKRVSVHVTETMCSTPSACLVVLQLLYQISKVFNIEFTNFFFDFNLELKMEAYQMKVEHRFKNVDERAMFVAEVVHKLFGDDVDITINDISMDHLTRPEVLLDNWAFKLSIMIDGGAASWWRRKVGYAHPCKSKLLDAPLIPLSLTNQYPFLNNGNGIDVLITLVSKYRKNYM